MGPSSLSYPQQLATRRQRHHRRAVSSACHRAGVRSGSAVERTLDQAPLATKPRKQLRAGVIGALTAPSNAPEQAPVDLDHAARASRRVRDSGGSPGISARRTPLGKQRPAQPRQPWRGWHVSAGRGAAPTVAVRQVQGRRRTAPGRPAHPPGSAAPGRRRRSWVLVSPGTGTREAEGRQPCPEPAPAATMPRTGRYPPPRPRNAKTSRIHPRRPCSRPVARAISNPLRPVAAICGSHRRGRPRRTTPTAAVTGGHAPVARPGPGAKPSGTSSGRGQRDRRPLSRPRPASEQCVRNQPQQQRGDPGIGGHVGPSAAAQQALNRRRCRGLGVSVEAHAAGKMIQRWSGRRKAAPPAPGPRA